MNLAQRFNAGLPREYFFFVAERRRSTRRERV